MSAPSLATQPADVPYAITVVRQMMKNYCQADNKTFKAETIIIVN